MACQLIGLSRIVPRSSNLCFVHVFLLDPDPGRSFFPGNTFSGPFFRSFSRFMKGAFFGVFTPFTPFIPSRWTLFSKISTHSSLCLEIFRLQHISRPSRYSRLLSLRDESVLE